MFILWLQGIIGLNQEIYISVLLIQVILGHWKEQSFISTKLQNSQKNGNDGEASDIQLSKLK